MPAVSVRKRGSLYRLIEGGGIARTEASGAARDGGGHKSKAKAVRQASYINAAFEKLGYK